MNNFSIGDRLSLFLFESKLPMFYMVEWDGFVIVSDGLSKGSLVA
jgi:hypothetical protein